MAEHPFIREFALMHQGGRLLGLVVPEVGEIRRRGFDALDAAVRQAVAEQGRRLPSYQRISGYVLVREPMPRTAVRVRTGQPLLPAASRREQLAWALYDFANSGYTTVVLTTVFGAYRGGSGRWAGRISLGMGTEMVVRSTGVRHAKV